MRLLHTADWHAGRNLRGTDRTPEIARALGQVLALAVDAKVDAILVAGDLFDTPNPSAEAELAVYEFFLQAGQAKIPSVVIAGNHDSPQRLESVSGLLKRVQVHALGAVKPGLRPISLETNNGPLVVAALPFLSERRLVKAAHLLESGLDVGAWRQKYREGMAFFTHRLSEGFQASAVNIMMLHTTVEGGTLSNSEFGFYVTNSYTIHPDTFPSSAAYVALGHLHKPQRVNEIPSAEYAGSLIQLDFGEAGDHKRVNIIEAEAGRRAKVSSIELSLEKPLRVVRVDLENLERRLEEFRGSPGYLKVIVQTPEPKPGLKDRVLGVLPQALAVEVELSEGVKRSIQNREEHLSPLEAFEWYYSQKRGMDLPNNLKQAFLELQLEVLGDAGDGLDTRTSGPTDATDAQPEMLEPGPFDPDQPPPEFAEVDGA